ncbi:hypothetical protein CfE428DRAFT_3561 [Chthoniobacter flavus Ellin428]|uniref:Uncharacterized protein n=1 Tax=Chthoniobacter flavus Ellin428 TaxID=497964 RepID=B4D3S3_9BACT|nr:hypothetical protein [Chthoniobacter flavus]EDY18903.1 hypothetical protein CfE428DRAFT_3561 [Chthoniobacter flavus Ellin428]TCO93492.1 hypothetical protein EV701_104196 [Chthoniobacter flavus]
MKTLLALGVALGLPSLSALGIPQTIQSPVLVVGTNLTFEQLATDPGSWGATSSLKGNWKTQGDTLTLGDPVAVFGIAADEITARQQDGQVQSFRVVFRPKEKSTGNLLSRVAANVRAFTGNAGTKAGDTTVFKYKGVTITLRSGAAHEVVAEFTRA